MTRIFTLLTGALFAFISGYGQCEGLQPGANATGGVLTCINETITLQGDSPTSNVLFTWIGPNGFISSEQNPEVSEVGAYLLEVRNPATGCASYDFVIIVANLDEPDVSATGGVIPCSSSAVQLTGTSSTPNVQYTWSGPNGYTSENQSPVVHTPGAYFLTATHPTSGCESLEEVAVGAVPGACLLEPVVINDVNVTVRGTNMTGSVLTNDYHPQGYELVLEGFRRVSDSGPFREFVLIPGQGSLSLTDPLSGAYEFVPDTGFSGETETMEYQACDTETGQCKSAKLTIKVVNDLLVNNPPIAIDDHFQVAMGTSFNGKILANDFDSDNDPITINVPSSSGITSNGGSWTLNPDNTFSYTPLPGFTGFDHLFFYEICDGVSGCDIAAITVTVLEPGAENFSNPSAVDDCNFSRPGIPSTRNLLANDLPGSGSELFSVASLGGEIVDADGTSVFTENGGVAFITQDGSFTYLAPANYSGSDKLEYQVCNNEGACDIGTVYLLVLPAPCIDVDISVWLEGAFDLNTGQMTTHLNITHSILPGQIPINENVEPTPPGNPYRDAQWGYNGTFAEEFFIGPYISPEGKAVTDWVLVTFRTGSNPSVEVVKAAGLLYEDGSISFIEPCFLRSSTPQDIWIVIEHRNHMGVMTNEAVSIDVGKLVYDFRQDDSYSTPSSFGQKEVAPGVWAMFSGDADQSDWPSYDINGSDIIQWEMNNGSFNKYINSDFDLNGDINGADNILFNANNGLSSTVPKD
ncbi:MAG: Ig-like domain-containing protein [Bacteroidota bacterium]